MKRKWNHFFSVVLVISLWIGGIHPVFVVAANRTIAGNGTGGITIDINSAPYSTKNYNGIAYGQLGCTWFVASRVQELTGKDTAINGPNYWYNTQYQSMGFSRGQTLKAKAIACYYSDNNHTHVSIIERVIGDKVIVSEGGYKSGNAANGYCRIFETTKDYVENGATIYNGKFLGYVYFQDDNPDTEDPSISNVQVM